VYLVLMYSPETAEEALRDLAVAAGVMKYCAKHGVYSRGPNGAEAALPFWDRNIEAVRRFFPTPVHFDTALRYLRSKHPLTYCPQCTKAVGFV
jgi:hypothetical protein